jgi:hypothetical protein
MHNRKIQTKLCRRNCSRGASYSSSSSSRPESWRYRCRRFLLQQQLPKSAHRCCSSRELNPGWCRTCHYIGSCSTCCCTCRHHRSCHTNSSSSSCWCATGCWSQAVCWWCFV